MSATDRHGTTPRFAAGVRAAALTTSLAAACALTAAALAPAALATTWHVDDDAATDPGTCDPALTYRSLLPFSGETGCAGDGDTIAIAAGTYPLGTDVLLYRDVLIRGAGAAATVLTSTGDRDLRVVGTGWLGNPGTVVEIRGLSFSAVGIRSSGSLALDSVVIRDFDREDDAPLHSGGTRFGPHANLTLANSTITGNRGRQGALFNDNFSTATLVNTTVANNRGVVSGAIFNFGDHLGVGSLTLVNSTVTGNHVDTSTPSADLSPRGGGIWSMGTTTLTNTVVAGNSAPVAPDCYGPADGAGGHNFIGALAECGVNERVLLNVSGEPTGGSYTLSFEGATTFPIPHDATTAQVVAALEALPTIGAGNIYAPAEWNSGSTDWAELELKSDLGASDQPAVAVTSSLVGGTVSVGTVVDGVSPQIAPGVNGNLTGPDPVLGPMSSNGGAVPTSAPLPGSPLIGAGDPGTCQAAPIDDQDARGRRRWAALRGCDVGAYDTAGFGQRTPGQTSCSTAVPRMSVTPPALKAGPPDLQYVVWRTVFRHFNGAGWNIERAPWVISLATPELATSYHWSATGSYLGDSDFVRQSSLAAGALISFASHEAIALDPAVSGYEPALLTTASGPAALAGAFCYFGAGTQPSARLGAGGTRFAPPGEWLRPPLLRAPSRQLARSLVERAANLAAGERALTAQLSSRLDRAPESHVRTPATTALPNGSTASRGPGVPSRARPVRRAPHDD